MPGSSEVKLGDSVLVVDDNNLVGVGRVVCNLCNKNNVPFKQRR